MILFGPPANIVREVYNVFLNERVARMHLRDTTPNALIRNDVDVLVPSLFIDRLDEGLYGVDSAYLRRRIATSTVTRITVTRINVL